eukprot:1144784-Pelagomonas_calceolata.AAC.3
MYLNLSLINNPVLHRWLCCAERAAKGSCPALREDDSVLCMPQGLRVCHFENEARKMKLALCRKRRHLDKQCP